MKILRNICLALLGVGVVLCIGGAALGGTVYASFWDGGLHTWREAMQTAKGYVLREWYDRDGYHRDWFDEDDDWFDSSDEWFGTSGNAFDTSDLPKLDEPMEGLTDYPLPDSSRIHSLDLELEGADVVIQNGDALALSADAGRIDVETDDGVLSVEETRGAHASKTRVRLTLPAGMRYDEIDIQASGGVISLDALECNEFSLDLKGADVTIHSLAAREADLSAGAGIFNVGRLESLGINLACDAGTGSIGLPGTQADYAVYASCNLGVFRMDGQEILSGIAGKTTLGHGPREIHAAVGVGTLDLAFGM